MQHSLDLELLELVVFQVQQGLSELIWREMVVMISVEWLEVLLNRFLVQVLVKDPDDHLY